MSSESAKVLIVDDEVVVRRLLERQLTKEGYICYPAAGASEAEGVIEKEHPDLALIDIRMPGKSGVELLREVRERREDMAAIMVTGVNDTETAVQCLRLGAFDYVIKPFDSGELIIRIENALERRRLELENREYQETLERRVLEQNALLSHRVRELDGLNKLFQTHLNESLSVLNTHRYLANNVIQLADKMRELADAARRSMESVDALEAPRGELRPQGGEGEPSTGSG